MTGGDPLPQNINNCQRADLISKVASQVIESILELEAALQDRKLDELIGRPELVDKIGISMTRCYTDIAERKLRHDYNFRQKWIEVFIKMFQISLQCPQKNYPARLGPQYRRVHTILASGYQGDVILSDNQAVSVRRWGIGFDFEDEKLAKRYFDNLVRLALSNLESNICSLRYIETTYMSGYSRLSSDAKYEYDGIGKRFEHLMYDTLNEQEQHARFAPLMEDLLEKTDLRISYPSLKRRGGARIQVSLSANPDFHRDKVDALHLPEEFIFLTPLDLAHCAISPPELPLFENFEWDVFWASLGEKYQDEIELAHILHDLFVDALSFPRLNPHGPMWILPPTLRQFIRIFTEYRANEATNCIRIREQSKGVWIGTSRKFTRGIWKIEFSDAP